MAAGQARPGSPFNTVPGAEVGSTHCLLIASSFHLRPVGARNPSPGAGRYYSSQ